jgi:hypothetical protein
MACALALVTARAGFADQSAFAAPPPFLEPPWIVCTADNPQGTQPVRFGETPQDGGGVSPAAEILGFELLLNRYDYYVIDKQTFGVTYSSIKKNLRSKWVFDNDPFSVNQFLHPYQGTVFFGLARSSGRDYWESLWYSIGGSLLWEIAGETSLPSINDLIATGIGGTFLGEPLYRMASLILQAGGETPGFWREMSAAVVSPPLAFNRLVLGERFRAFDSRDPAIFTNFRLGGANTRYVRGQGVSQVFRPNEGIAEFHMAYGLPGKPGYEYRRPFDYFDFQFTASSANMFESIMSRGLLVAKDYEAGKDYRGVWGLYGSYDYISPQLYRVSTTALSLGTTAQWWLTKALAVQGTVLGGVGYGAGGTIHGAGERDYHYGATPQGLVALNFIFGDRANLDLTGRRYNITRTFSTEDRGSERITRLDAAFTWRMHGPHAVTLKYVASERKATYPDIDNQRQKVGTISLLYNYLFDEKPGDTKFGAVDWRGADNGGR